MAQTVTIQHNFLDAQRSRELVEGVVSGRLPLDQIENQALDPVIVAEELLRGTRQMRSLAQSAGLSSVVTKMEEAFYDSYGVVAAGKPLVDEF